MLKKCVLPCALAVLLMAVVVGCSSEKKQVDPYAEGSLRQLTRGPVIVSKGYRYKLRNPQVIQAKKHLVLIREGNLVEFLVGRSIADKIEDMDRSNIEFNVVKKFSPFVHFKCEQVVSGTDTVFLSQAGAINYPRLTKPDEFKDKEYDDYSIDRFQYNRTVQLNKTQDKKFKLSGTTLTLVEEDGDEVFMLTGNRGTLRVAEPGDGLMMILRLIVENNLSFDGGITVTEIEPWTERKNNQISATVDVDFVSYNGWIVSG